MFTSLTIAGAGGDPTRGGHLFADGAQGRLERRATRAFELPIAAAAAEGHAQHHAKPTKVMDLLLPYDMSRVGVDMAFRLWLKLSKLFVAASALSERIATAIRDHRTPPKTPPTPHQ